jgi:hypothetical protein
MDLRWNASSVWRSQLRRLPRKSKNHLRLLSLQKRSAQSQSSCASIVPPSNATNASKAPRKARAQLFWIPNPRFLLLKQSKLPKNLHRNPQRNRNLLSKTTACMDSQGNVSIALPSTFRNKVYRRRKDATMEKTQSAFTASIM